MDSPLSNNKTSSFYYRVRKYLATKRGLQHAHKSNWCVYFGWTTKLCVVVYVALNVSRYDSTCFLKILLIVYPNS